MNATDPATGMTAHLLAASLGHDDVVFLLTKGMQTQDIQGQTPQGDTALPPAAAEARADVVNLLLTKGAQQDHKNVALASVATAGQVNLVSLLLQQGTNVNHADAHGSTALHNASVSCCRLVRTFTTQTTMAPHR